MAVRNIKDIHNRILANFGESNQSALKIEGDCNYSCADAHVSAAGSIPVTLPSVSIVVDTWGKNMDRIDQRTATVNSSLVSRHSENCNKENVTHFRTGSVVEPAKLTKEPALIDEKTTVEETDAQLLDAETRPSEEPSIKDGPETMHFITWEAELGARIYKVPEGKLASLQNQPHADRLKLFNNLEQAKVEANTIFERVAAKRKAKGLPRSILEPLLEDFKSWDEINVPQYFL